MLGNNRHAIRSHSYENLNCHKKYKNKVKLLKEEHRPRGFENRVLRRIFGPKKDEVTGD
jgi:hypothetical protein